MDYVKAYTSKNMIHYALLESYKIRCSI